MDTSYLPARSRFGSSRRSSLLRRIALGCGVLGLTAGAALAPSAAGAAGGATPKIYFGLVGSATNLPVMSSHFYTQLNRKVPDTRMITMGSDGVHWAALAAAGPGSAVYNDLVRWAETLKTRPGPIYLTIGHEPESKAYRAYGTSAQYVLAFRHVVNIFRSLGVTNVQWTWQMTNYAFEVSSSDSRYAPKWYPGDSYVDVVGFDAYNWSDCRGGPWEELSQAAGPPLQFARAHGKPAVIGEFASGPGPKRAQWLKNVEAFLIANSNTIRAAYYFDIANTSACNWRLSSAADLGALRAISQDPHFSS
jgi:hypothetical protein